jgi:uncharacterized protein (DUF1697 family)
MPRQIVLLRGVNVGGSRRLPMAALRELLTGLGYEDVATYLQSGNVVLTSDLAPDELARRLQTAIADGLGVDPQVVVRTRAELAAVVDGNPLSGVEIDPKRFQVSFLSAAPDAEVVRALEAADVAPERVAIRGREVYAWHPEGVQNSPLAKLLTDRRLGVIATARNWNTVTKLLELADAQPPASTTS